MMSSQRTGDLVALGAGWGRGIRRGFYDARCLDGSLLALAVIHFYGHKSVCYNTPVLMSL